MENEHQDDQLEDNKDEQVYGIFSPFRDLIRDLVARENGRRILTIGGVVLLVIVVIVVIRAFYPQSQDIQQTLQVFEDQPPEEESTTSQSILEMPSFVQDQTSLTRGIHRAAVIHTSIPTRARVDVLKYEVKQGDSLFAIAETFGLKPETVLWGNFDTLADNPHTLQPGQELNILPTNGTYHEWRDGESLLKVAD